MPEVIALSLHVRWMTATQVLRQTFSGKYVQQLPSVKVRTRGVTWQYNFEGALGKLFNYLGNQKFEAWDLDG